MSTTWDPVCPCGDTYPADEGCHHGRDWCGPCSAANCRECAQDVADDHAAEVAVEEWREARR